MLRLNEPKSISSGSAPDPDGGAYCAPQIPWI